ncbi:bacterio-opsin activator [Natronococcus pandeyae]|uniref:Bacterio-opsin activator n=1 Tax=Natronococcus pandeyae TaxID=2055836 RepID=A0A8J8PZX6_9EURY|nr:helix-turn-helix domain-containing protein [Natronococcus pandeyae]TYL36244.1 bacterio-opsin activator [Natronococcus pandeyae]
MTTIAEVTLSPDDFALGETVRSLPDLELRVESVVVEDSTRTAPLVWFSGADRDAIEEALAADRTVEEFDELLEQPEDDEWLYRIQYAEEAGSVCNAIHANDGTVLEVGLNDSQWTLRLLFPHREGLSVAVDDIEESDARVDVRRMVEADQDGNLEMTATLTDPQQEAIAEAYRHGYYDVPREISLEELARELEISHQALSERLRRANRVLASEQLEGGGPVDEMRIN